MHTGVQLEVSTMGDHVWPPKDLGDPISSHTEHSNPSPNMFLPQVQRAKSWTCAQDEK